jgi:hypothetical protein
MERCVNDESRLRESTEALRLEMEELASKLKDLVLAQPPRDLLGFLWAGLINYALGVPRSSTVEGAGDMSQRDALLVALEYVHAVLSCFDTQHAGSSLRQDLADELLAVAQRLREVSVIYCITSSRPDITGAFGDETGRVEFLAKSAWAAIRGNRYQVLEEEFFCFILGPHEEALLQVYGIGAAQAAAGIQAIANAMREGHAHAIEELGGHIDYAYHVANERGITIDEVLEQMKRESPEAIAASLSLLDDLFRGGLCNLSHQTALPAAFLEDLSFKRGENTEFFAPGPFCGTPLRTLPGRIRPLIRLEDGFYATDPQFVRDAAYRAIQRGLATRLPEYRRTWNEKQKALTETAFQCILGKQLEDAIVLTEVHYRDPTSQQWMENDALILLDDVMLQIEVKAGIGAMHSPATNFASHVRAIRGLVVKAYNQAKRFLEYLDSAPEVSLYALQESEYVEVRRVRLSDFRCVIPIGLTVESFAPFSAMCKVLPEVTPLLDKYPFISMSIDDLFILNRFLPAPGARFHYLEVRQQVAGIRQATIFDEIDHLGAYIAKNRFDMALREQLSGGANHLLWDGFSSEIDEYFASDRWLREAPPSPILSRRTAAGLRRTCPDPCPRMAQVRCNPPRLCR